MVSRCTLTQTFHLQSECCTLYVYFVPLNGEIVPFIFIMKLSRFFHIFFILIPFAENALVLVLIILFIRLIAFHSIPFSQCAYIARVFRVFFSRNCQQLKSVICTVHIFKSIEKKKQTHTHKNVDIKIRFVRNKEKHVSKFERERTVCRCSPGYRCATGGCFIF